MEAVLRPLRGEPLEVLTRELGVEAHRLAAWRDDFLRAARRRSKVHGLLGLASGMDSLLGSA
jgi:hypothetical protein